MCQAFGSSGPTMAEIEIFVGIEPPGSVSRNEAIVKVLGFSSCSDRLVECDLRAGLRYYGPGFVVDEIDGA